MKMHAWSIIFLGMFCVAGACVHAQGQALSAPQFTAAQAARGEIAFANNCSACHGKNLDNGEFAPALKGPAFKQNWGSKTLGDLFAFVTTQMPPDNPGGLDPSIYTDILSYIASQNGAQAGAQELPTDPNALQPIKITN